MNLKTCGASAKKISRFPVNRAADENEARSKARPDIRRSSGGESGGGGARVVQIDWDIFLQLA